ncbi:MAG: hypothetical protein KC983_01440, partial [Phycisphaerales bacterium]|nr:hypothetical protein [Phycisphaerales bacterium]
GMRGTPNMFGTNSEVVQSLQLRGSSRSNAESTLRFFPHGIAKDSVLDITMQPKCDPDTFRPTAQHIVQFTFPIPHNAAINLIADFDKNTWSITHAEDTWGEGDLPVPAEDIAAMIEKARADFDADLPPALADDITRVLNLDADGLAEFTNWQGYSELMHPNDFNETPTTLQNSGYSRGSIPLFSPRILGAFGVVGLVALFAVVWLIGLLCIFSRRRRLLAMPPASPEGAAS